MPRKRDVRAILSICALTLAGTGVLAAPAGAATEGPPPRSTVAVPWMGTFNLSVNGTEKTNWAWHHEATDSCDASIDGAGSETDDMIRSGQATAFATGIGAQLVSVSGGGELTESLVMNRTGQVNEVDPTDPSCPGAGGGGGGNGTPPGAQCGTTSGTAGLILFGTAQGVHVDSDPTSFSTPNGNTSFLGCPNQGVYLPTLLPTDTLGGFIQGVAPGVLLATPTSFTFQGHTTDPLTNVADVTGFTNVDLTVNLDGVAIAPDVTASSSDLQLSPTGSGSVTLHCPKQVKVSCKGTLGVQIDASGGDAPTTFPTALATGAKPFGKSTRFAIKPGKKQKLKLALHTKPGTLSALDGVPLDVVVTLDAKNHKTVPEVVGVAHPKS